ncbi:hypothetical protein [Muricoccus aerilatus]|uniref:hypothetical protein n=1 Tax=Muricoccus aerilatus TaxID=452982 RepID=UPI0005C23A44|nr:hypothetical protein [Roseomonas aerilata]
MSKQYAIVAIERAAIELPGMEPRQVEAGDVVNVVLWDGDAEFDPGPGMDLLLIQEGWGVVDGRLAELPAPEEEPAPAPIRVIRSLAFRDRMPVEKQALLSVTAMQAAAAGDGALLTFLFNQAASTTTNLDDPRVQDGVMALIAADLLTEDEAAALLADGTPEEVG